ncbi:MAG: hypothetical protein CK530_03795 [Planctomycetaceae bacterium]|nr:MAG: hypothetical protein CK530_03795 [Planctomycetaceae bacterium]
MTPPDSLNYLQGKGWAGRFVVREFLPKLLWLEQPRLFLLPYAYRAWRPTIAQHIKLFLQRNTRCLRVARSLLYPAEDSLAIRLA